MVLLFQLELRRYVLLCTTLVPYILRKGPAASGTCPSSTSILRKKKWDHCFGLVSSKIFSPIYLDITYQKPRLPRNYITIKHK